MLSVIRGQDHDRVPFVQYDGIAAPNEEVWSLVGRESMGLLRWCGVYRFECEGCPSESSEFGRDGLRGVRTILHTPEGDLTEERLREPAYGSASIRKHFVCEPSDYRAFSSYLRSMRVVEDIEPYLKAAAELGEDGLPLARVERTPYQQMWVQWVSLEDLCVHLVEYPDKVEECLELLASKEREVLRIVRDVAGRYELPLVDIPDNLTAPAIGPRLFEKYCLPLYRELSEMMAEVGTAVFVHADGDLRPLWNLIGQSGITGLDSMSPPPDNDTSVADALREWPHMRLFANFPSSVHLARPQVIYEKAAEMIEQARGTGRLQIQISENVPRNVWRTSYPEIVRAINDCCR